jgi:hypothetical protein
MTTREYIFQERDRIFVWLLIDADTDEPIAGGATGSHEKAEQRLLKAKQENR